MCECNKVEYEDCDYCHDCVPVFVDRKYLDALENAISEIQNIVDAHTKDAYITCAENCWCWGISTVLTKIELFKSNDKVQGRVPENGD